MSTEKMDTKYGHQYSGHQKWKEWWQRRYRSILHYIRQYLSNLIGAIIQPRLAIIMLETKNEVFYSNQLRIARMEVGREGARFWIWLYLLISSMVWFKCVLLIAKQVKNLYKWTSIGWWQMGYLQWMTNRHSQNTNSTHYRIMQSWIKPFSL